VNKIFKGLIRFLIEVIVMTVLIVGINIFTNGMYLWGLPRINDIQSVNITTVWWNNKIHVIKDKEMFVNLTEGIFFLEDLQTK